MIGDRDLATLVADLVRIESVNPSLVRGGAGEAEVARFVAAWLTRAGAEVEVDDLDGRPLVVATVRGRGGGPTLLLNGHTDTVGVGQMPQPLEPRLGSGRLTARGAYDMKGGLAAAMAALASAGPLQGDLVLAAVPDEEAGGIGTRALLERRPLPDAAIVPEPTDLAVGIAHRGYVAFELETTGVAAHGSRPDLGVDAIAGMGPVLTELAALDDRLQNGPPHPLLGSASVHAGTISGGQETSTYPARCVVAGEWRTVPGADEPREALASLAAHTGATLRVPYEGRPFVIDAENAFVRGVLAHAGGDAVALRYWTDAALLAEAGIPTVLFGPSGGGAHGDDEWVDLGSVARVRDVLTAVARDFCGA